MSDKKLDYTFEFTPAYQEAIIGYCLVDSKFFHRCMDKIKPEWFTCGPTLITVYAQMIAFYNRHGYAPKCSGQLMLPEEMLNEPWFMQQPILERNKFQTEIIKCVASRDSYSLETIQKNMTGWLRKKLLQETYLVGANKLNKGGLDDSYEWANAKLKEIWNASFFDEFKVESFDGAVEFLQRTNMEYKTISTGCSKLDQAMGGGLFKGETCAVMAPTNAGKSRSLMTMARHAIVQGKKVLFISHEDSADKIKERLLASVVGLSPAQMRMILAYPDPDVPMVNGNLVILTENQKKLRKYLIEQLKSAEELLRSNMTYLPYVKTGKMFAESLVAEIHKIHETEILKTGRGFDMIVDDYPKKLKLKNRGGKDSLYRAELAEIYDMFNQLAVELGVHCLVAIQVNRVGAQMNKGRVENDKFLSSEEVDESYGIAQNMGCIVTLNRSDEDKAYNILHYSITKSRNERNDLSVTTRADYGANLLHGDYAMFQKFGMIMLREPLVSVTQNSNKKIPTLEAELFLNDEKMKWVQPMINGWIEEHNKELLCHLPVLGNGWQLPD